MAEAEEIASSELAARMRKERRVDLGFMWFYELGVLGAMGFLRVAYVRKKRLQMGVEAGVMGDAVHLMH